MPQQSQRALSLRLEIFPRSRVDVYVQPRQRRHVGPLRLLVEVSERGVDVEV